MKKSFKKISSVMVIAVACFGFVSAVFANSLYHELTGGNSIEVTESKNTNFRTYITADRLLGTPSVTTKISRKVLGFWIGNTANTQTIQYTTKSYYTDWNANGNNISTRATFINNSGNTSIRGMFELI